MKEKITLMKVGKEVFITSESIGKIMDYLLVTGNNNQRKSMQMSGISDLIEMIEFLSLGKVGMELEQDIANLEEILRYFDWSRMTEDQRVEKREELGKEIKWKKLNLQQIKDRRYMNEYAGQCQTLFNVIETAIELLKWEDPEYGTLTWQELKDEDLVGRLRMAISRIKDFGYPNDLISDKDEVGYVIKSLYQIVVYLMVKEGLWEAKDKEEEQFIKNFHSFTVNTKDQKFSVRKWKK